MEPYISKSAVVAEIERRRDLHYKYYMKNGAGSIAECKYDEDREILSFLNNLEVKEVYECNDVNLNPLFEEMGVEPDSRIALMFKNAFYKSVDNYLDRKENSYDRQRENP